MHFFFRNGVAVLFLLEAKATALPCPCEMSFPKSVEPLAAIQVDMAFKFPEPRCLAGVEELCLTVDISRHTYCVGLSPDASTWPVLDFAARATALRPGDHEVVIRARGGEGGDAALDPWTFFFTTIANGKSLFDYHSGEVLSPAERAKLFDSIYETGLWKDNLFGLDCPLSGCGSSHGASVLAREALQEVLATFGVKSIAEVGCGDHAWLQDAPLEDLGVAYTGSDISTVVVASNRLRFPHRRFEVADGVTSPPPVGELVVFRQVLMHLSEADNVAVLRQVEASARHRGAPRYLLASIHLNGALDASHLLLVGGTKRYLEPPYCLQAPLRMYRDDFVLDSEGGATASARVRATNDEVGVPLGMLALWRLDEPGGLFRRGLGCMGPAV